MLLLCNDRSCGIMQKAGEVARVLGVLGVWLWLSLSLSLSPVTHRYTPACTVVMMQHRPQLRNAGGAGMLQEHWSRLNRPSKSPVCSESDRKAQASSHIVDRPHARFEFLLAALSSPVHVRCVLWHYCVGLLSRQTSSRKPLPSSACFQALRCLSSSCLLSFFMTHPCIQ
jgi:hypothetical protein